MLCWELNSGPLEEHQKLLTLELPLRPPDFLKKKKNHWVYSLETVENNSLKNTSAYSHTHIYTYIFKNTNTEKFTTFAEAHSSFKTCGVAGEMARW